MRIRFSNFLGFLLISISQFAVAQSMVKKDSIFGVDWYVFGWQSTKDFSFHTFSNGPKNTFLLDSSYNLIKQFNYDPVIGGGGPFFLNNDSVLVFEIGGMEMDTVAIYNLYSKAYIGVPRTANYIRKLDERSVVFGSYRGVYGYLNVIDTTKSDKNWFNQRALSGESFVNELTNKIYFTTDDGIVEYDLDSYKKREIINGLSLEPRYLTFIDSSRIICKSGSFIYSIEYSDLQVNSVSYPTSFISGFYIDDYSRIWVYGNDRALHYFGMDNLELTKVELDSNIIGSNIYDLSKVKNDYIIGVDTIYYRARLMK